MDQPGTGAIMMGTPIDKLGEGPMSASDDDLVQSIFKDVQKPASMSNPVMNAPSFQSALGSRPELSQSTGLHMGAPMPPAGARAPMVINNQGQQMPHMPDPHVATAHMIGSAHPTQSDFQQMMMASNQYGGMGGGMGNGMGYAPAYPQGPVIAADAPKKNWNAIWVDELRQPFIVMIILFVITLPWFHLLTSHYTPQLLKPTGEFTTIGLVVRAALGGALFWFLQRIVAPLIVL